MRNPDLTLYPDGWDLRPLGRKFYIPGVYGWRFSHKRNYFYVGSTVNLYIRLWQHWHQYQTAGKFLSYMFDIQNEIMKNAKNDLCKLPKWCDEEIKDEYPWAAVQVKLGWIVVDIWLAPRGALRQLEREAIIALKPSHNALPGDDFRLVKPGGDNAVTKNQNRED